MSIFERYWIMSTEQTQNKMGTMPVRKLLISMSLPMMASMLVQALYNIVDSIFVSRVSEAALTAVSISFPIQNLMISLGVGIGVGVNALLSKSLGEGNQKHAQRIALQGIFIELICCLIFILIGFFAMDVFSAVRPTMRRSSPSARTICRSAAFSPWVCSHSLFLSACFRRPAGRCSR